MACKVGQRGDLSKLLWTLLGLNLNTPNVDQSLYAKIPKNLELHELSLVGMVVICNQILLSTSWFFIDIWRGSNKILRKIKRGASETTYGHAKSNSYALGLVEENVACKRSMGGYDRWIMRHVKLVSYVNGSLRQ